MTLLLPAALLVGLLAVPILLLYLLRLRRQDTPVSSILLWQQVLRDRQANAPWQKLKRNLLLILQLLILAALTLALARPARPVASVASGSLVILLDASASMNALDGAENPAASASLNRFESARTLARGLIEGLPSGSAASLILVSGQPEILSAGEVDRSLLLSALDVAQPSQEAADWQAALALASGAARSVAAQKVTTILVSDGGLEPELALPALPGEVLYLPVGVSADNLALAAFSGRASETGLELFARVQNYGSNERSLLLSFYRGADLLDARPLTLAAGASQGLSLRVGQTGAAQFTARITPAATTPGGGKERREVAALLDPFPLDDTAYFAYQPARTGRTLLVSPGNLFLESALSSLPGIQPFRLPGPPPNSALALPDEPFDLYVLDGVLPDPLPPGNLLLIHPPANELFLVTAPFSDTAPAALTASPLARFLDWSAVHVRQAQDVRLPAWAQVVVDSPGGPLVFAGETGSRRVAVITFDLHDSDLPLQVDFPILLANLTGYLLNSDASLQGADTGGYLTGASLHLTNRGDARPFALISSTGASQTFVQGTTLRLREPGFYRVRYSDGQETALAANLFSPLESAIAPAASLQLGRQEIGPAQSQEVSWRELWPWLAALGLGFLMVEWWVYHGRVRPVFLHLSKLRKSDDQQRR